MSIITVSNLSKKYIIGHDRQAAGIGHRTLRDSISHLGRSAFQRLCHPLSPNRENTDLEEFWALKDVSFEINQGERVGIIGRNGAGKSTLLKILSRITEPTMGKIQIKGRVASLLEVGTGFHPELSGRENIFLNGAVLGMARAEIKRKFDEIVDFSGVEKFLDTPVKHYSSGMYVRLAFAVAAHLDPEILIIDEVLAVGDGAFQKKCLGKMRDISGQGRTIIFVSHSMPMIASLCSRCILLSEGKVHSTGNPGDVIAAYQCGNRSSPSYVDYANSEKAPGDNLACLIAAWVEDINGKRRIDLEITEPIRIVMKYRILSGTAKTPSPNFHFYDSAGQYIFVSAPENLERENPCPSGEYLVKCEIPANFLNDGLFSVGVALTFILPEVHVSFFDNHALSFNITDPIHQGNTRKSGYYGRIPGIIRPQLSWKQEKIS